MRRLPALLGLALAALGGGACDWTVFDDLAQKAPIRAVARPDSMDSSTFPAFVLPVAKPRGSAELLVLGTDNTALADFTFAADGHLGNQTVSNDRFTLDGVKVGALSAAAYLEDAIDDVPRIVAVVEEQRQPILVTLDSPDHNFAVETLGAALTVEVGAIAVGAARVAGERDVVLASGSQLIVMPNATAAGAPQCNLDSAVVSLAVGEQWVVAGQPTGNGAAWVVKPDYVAGTEGKCANTFPLEGYTGAQGFGTVVLATNLVVDPWDIVVSAPQERAIYFYSSVAGTMYGDGPLRLAGADTGCGTAMAIGTVEGQPTLIIGDPGDPGDLSVPGTVWLQDITDLKAPLVQLENPNPTDYVRFGEQVGVVSFTHAEGSAVDLVWVTAQAVTQGDPGVIYLYFWVRNSNTDPRVIQN
jgi:hypothetical protein